MDWRLAGLYRIGKLGLATAGHCWSTARPQVTGNNSATGAQTRVARGGAEHPGRRNSFLCVFVCERVYKHLAAWSSGMILA
jgi:hypothetical protein